MAATTVGVCRETVPGENRVALVPEAVARAGALELAVLVETGAGAAAGYPDEVYAQAGGRLVGRADLLAESDVLLAVQPPTVEPGHRYRYRQVLVGLLQPWRIPFQARRWVDQGLTVFSLDLPLLTATGGFRPLDAVGPQERLAGYRAVLLGAGRLERCLAGGVGPDAFARPVRVLVVGDGPAARQATATAQGLGAEVHGLGPETAGAGDAALRWVLPRFDLVVTAVEAVGGPAPVLLTPEALGRMNAGSVVVDLSGNVAGAPPGGSTTVPPGVTLIGPANHASQLTATASAWYAASMVDLLGHLVHQGLLIVDPADPVLAAFLFCHHGAVPDPIVQQLLQDATAVALP